MNLLCKPGGLKPTEICLLLLPDAGIKVLNRHTWLYFLTYYVCVYECVPKCRYGHHLNAGACWGSEETLDGSSGTVLTDCEPPCECKENQEKASLGAKPSFQSLFSFTILSENLGGTPSSHVVANNYPYRVVSGYRCPLLISLGTRHACTA